MARSPISNAVRELVIHDRWSGGVSTFKKGGQKGSVDFLYGCDIYSDPASVRGLPRTTLDSDATVTAKIIDMVRVPDGSIYMLQTDKKFIKRDANGVYSTIGTISGDTNGMGLFYWPQKDTIYITSDTSVSTYGRLSASPTLSHNVYTDFIDQTITVAGNAEYPDQANIQGWWKMEEESAGSASAGGDVSLIVVAGGGGGGGETGSVGASGGGGAGGYLADSSHAVVVGDYTVTVGAAGGGGGDTNGDDGGNSVFDTFTAVGGGGGAGRTGSTSGRNGGSGGGGKDGGSTAGGTGTGGQGTNGAAGNDGANTGGGGGGATSAGSGATGGAGTASSISGASVTYAAGGGGGTGSQGASPGTPGSGGGGGRENGGGGGAGASGAAGIVIISYPTGTVEATGGTITTSGGNTIHTFTSSGTFTVGSSVTRADTTTNNNDLTDNGGMPSTTDAAQGNRAVDMEADSQHYLSIPDASQTGLDFTSDCTLAGWFELESAPGSGNRMGLISKWTSAGDLRAYRFTYFNDGGTFKLAFAVSSDGTAANTTEVTVTKTLTVGTRYHLAVVYDADGNTTDGTAKFYVDAVQEGATQTGLKLSIANTTAAFEIGRSDGGSYLDGIVDEVIVWNTAEPLADIEDAKNAASGDYALGTSIVEDDDNSFYFTPDWDPHVSVVVAVTAKGTGDWTLTVHDDGNNVVATKTIANASLTNAADNTFTFSSNWRPQIGATYHIHATSTVADGTIATGTSLTTMAGRLVSPLCDAHPMIDFTTFMVVCDERYIRKFDGLLVAATDSDGTATSSWTTALTLPSGFETTCVARYKEFLVFGAEKRGTATDTYSEGLLVFWDGISAAPNLFINIPEGGVMNVKTDGGSIVFQAGLRGEVFTYSIGMDTHEKLFRLPKTTDTTYVRGWFANITDYLGLTIIANAFSTDNSAFNTLAYAWGHQDRRIGKALNPAWYPSHGNRTGTTREIGACKGFGTRLFIAWKSGSSYGVDIVAPANARYAEWGIEGRIEDENEHWNTKYARVLRADHQALVSADSDSVQLDYDIDQAGSFTSNTPNTTNGKKHTRHEIKKEFKDIQWRVTAKNNARIHTVLLDIEPRRNSLLP